MILFLIPVLGPVQSLLLTIPPRPSRQSHSGIQVSVNSPPPPPLCLSHFLVADGDNSHGGKMQLKLLWKLPPASLRGEEAYYHLLFMNLKIILLGLYFLLLHISPHLPYEPGFLPLRDCSFLKRILHPTITMALQQALVIFPSGFNGTTNI